MKIEVTRTFIDKQAADLDDAEVEVGSTMTVSAARGAQLIALRIAKLITSSTHKQAKAPKRAQ